MSIEPILNSKPIVCYGEILYDVFPNKKLIGGAPFNVSRRIHTFNYPSILVSRVGNDGEGKRALSYLQEKKIPIDFVQIDKKFLTGRVKVKLKQGNPTYGIIENVAWDHIEYSKELNQLVSHAEVLIFGSLSSRSPKSRQTLSNLTCVANNRVFDVNLRYPYFDEHQIKELMDQADFLKCNDEELEILCRFYHLTSRVIKSQIKDLMHKTNLKHICVTLGSFGSILYFNQQFYSDNGFQIKVVDTVGAGDSFLGTLIHGLYTTSDIQPQTILERANALGALVASKSGANPTVSENEIHQLISSRNQKKRISI